MKRFGIGFGVASVLLALAGCGGGGTPASSGGSGGSGGGGTTATPAAKGTALVTVDTVKNTATVTPLDPSSRAVFSGAAVALGSIKVNEDAGEVTARQLAITVTNNTQSPISNLRFTVSGVTPVTTPVTDDRANVTVSTYAGNGSTGSAGGSLLSANVSAPYGIWTDTDGSVYYTASSGDAIKKIAGGVVSTLYTSATILPYGLTGDANFLYFCDYTHHLVWRMRKDGTGLQVIAGTTGSPGKVDGAPGTSKLDEPSSLTMDSQGNIWVADFLNNAVREITNPGGSTPMLTSPNIVGFSITTPYSIADATIDGTEYIAVGQYSSAAKVYLINTATLNDVPLTGATSTTGLTGAANTVGFNIVKGLVASGDTFVVAESGRNDLKVIARPAGAAATDSASWFVATVAGTGTAGSVDGSGTAATFNNPTGLTFGRDGSLLVADTSNNKIRRVVISNFTSLSGVGTAPAGAVVSVGSPDTYVANADGNNYPAFLLPGTLSAGSSATLNPWAFDLSTGVTAFQFVVTVDGGTSYDAVLDAVNHSSVQGSSLDYVRTLTRPAGSNSTTVLTGLLADVATTAILYPCFASDGTAYLATNDQIMRVDTGGHVTVIAGQPTTGSADGVGRAASFNHITGLACTSDGSALYVTDSDAVRRISGSGPDAGNWTVSTIAGVLATGGYVRGSGAVTRFNSPGAIAVSPDGSNVYVGDSYNYRISVLTLSNGNGANTAASWYCQDIAGNGTQGYVDGTTSSEIGYCAGLAVTPVGDVVFTDETNCRIRRTTTGGIVSTLCGNGTSGYVDGPATSAELVAPLAIATAPSGYIYFTDDNANSIRRISPSGDVETIGQTLGANQDGSLATSSIQGGFTLAVSPTGVVWYNASNTLRSIERIVGN